MSAKMESTNTHAVEPQEPTQFRGGSITASEVHATGTINQVNAKEVHFKDGGIFLVQAGSVELKDGGAFLISTQNGSLVDSSLAVILSDQIEMVQSGSQVVLARNVQADQIKSKVLIARTVNGNVEAVLDGPRAAVAGLTAGIGLGVALSLVSFVLRKLRS